MSARVVLQTDGGGGAYMTKESVVEGKFQDDRGSGTGVSLDAVDTWSCHDDQGRLRPELDTYIQNEAYGAG